MTWFQALNPLLVIASRRHCYFYWRRQADAGRDTLPGAKNGDRRADRGGRVFAAGGGLDHRGRRIARAGFGWFSSFIIFTLGELYILPTGLGLFARLAPPRLGATTVAAWFLAIFTGSMLAGVVGTLWSSTSHGGFFVLLSGLGLVAAIFLWLLDHPIRRIEANKIL